MVTIPVAQPWVAQSVLPAMYFSMKRTVMQPISVGMPMVLLTVKAYNGFRLGRWEEDTEDG